MVKRPFAGSKPFTVYLNLLEMMIRKNLIQELWQSRIVSGSVILFTGGAIANLGNYLFHLLMGRFLGPASYGVLASLVSILYLAGVPSSTIVLTASKFASSYKARNELEKVKFFLIRASQGLYLAGFLVFLGFLFFQQGLARFLKIEESFSFVFIGGLFFLTFLSAANNGFLQGFQKFAFLSINSIFGTLIKLVFGVVLVLKGFGVGGVLVALLLASFFPYLISFYPLRFLFFLKFKKIDGKVFFKKIFSFASTTFIASLGLVLLYTMDVIWVKHFFAEFEAGLYGAVSTIGKAILFVATPIISVMFPLIAEAHAKKENFRRLFGVALGLISLVSVSVFLGYLFLPRLAVWFFFGTRFLTASYLLGRFSFFILLYTFCMLFVNFFLSIKKTRIAWLVVGASVFQTVGILFFHQSLFQVINISTLASALLLLSLVLYYFYFRK